MTTPQRSVYWYTVQKPTINPPPGEDMSADILIVGGGAAGLSTTHKCAKYGRSVILLKRDFCGAGASGKSSGLITPDSELELSQLIRRFGIERAKLLWEFAVSGVRMIRENIQTFHIECDYQVQDSLFAANSESGFKEVCEEYEARKHIGYASTLYPAQELPKIIGTNGYYGGVRYPDTFGINAYLYCQGMKRAVEQEGGAGI